MIYSYEIIIRIIIKRLKFVMLKQSKNHYRNRMITEKLNEIRIKISIHYRKYLFHPIFFQKYNNHAESIIV